MIFLVAASAISLLGTQATIAAPTTAFRTCLREATAKATTEKVTGDGIEAYLKTACTSQMGTLKDALIAFRMKNGMSRKAAGSDADMTVDDYVATPVEIYKFMVAKFAPTPAPAATATAPAAIPAAVTQPPKP